MGEKPDNLSDISETRTWKALDKIADRLLAIETQLSDIVRLQERMNTHDEAIRRYGKRLDHHDSRLRETELWQANHGDRSSSERLISNVQEDLHDMTGRVDNLESDKDISDGQKGISKQFLKWIAGLLAGIILLMVGAGD